MVSKVKVPKRSPGSEIAPGVMIGGRYRIEHKLADGGMGSVWVARHVALGVRLAIKVLGAAETRYPDAHERFEREARAAAVLGAETDHVVRIFDYGFDVRGPYIAMELLEGESLAERLAMRSRLSRREAAIILAQIARGLRKAHAAGMVHRDLKPENLFLARHVGEEERVKILDFGIVKLLPPGGSPVATLAAGTLHYMSPEVVDGKPIDTRADLWSLGVLLYRMVVGRLPFSGDDFVTVMRAILASDASPPSRTVPRLGPDMDAFFARALARDPDQRFQTVDELEAAFTRATRVSRRPPASAPSSAPTPPVAPSEPEAPAAEAPRGPIELMPTLRSPVSSWMKG